MTLYYYMYMSWQDCCRRGENRSWPSVSVESVDSENWCLNNAIVYAFIMRLTVEERVFILESYLKTMSYVHCRQRFFEKYIRQAPYIKIRSIGPLLSWTSDTWCSLCFECFVRISEQTTAFALYVINWLVFITVVESVYSAVRTDSLYKADYVCSLNG